MLDVEVALARKDHQLVDKGTLADDVDHVAPFEQGVSLGNQGFAAAGDGHDAERQILRIVGKVGAGLVEQL